MPAWACRWLRHGCRAPKGEDDGALHCAQGHLQALVIAHRVPVDANHPIAFAHTLLIRRSACDNIPHHGKPRFVKRNGHAQLRVGLAKGHVECPCCSGSGRMDGRHRAATAQDLALPLFHPQGALQVLHLRAVVVVGMSVSQVSRRGESRGELGRKCMTRARGAHASESLVAHAVALGACQGHRTQSHFPTTQSPQEDGHGCRQSEASRQQSLPLRKVPTSFPASSRQSCPSRTRRINKPSSSTKANATRCPSSMGA